jgi:hypothetical protein
MAICDSCHKEQHHSKRWRTDKNGHVIL